MATPSYSPTTPSTAINTPNSPRLLIELTEVGKRHGVRFPQAFTLLLKQFLYFDRYVRLLAPELQPWLDERVQLGRQGDGSPGL